MELRVKYLENYNKEWGELSSKDGDSGFDVRAAIPETIVLKAGERKLVPTGLKVAMSTVLGGTNEVEIQVRPRSGLALKKGITVVNAPGTVDFSYRGEIGVILLNTGSEDFEINPGDRIAQIVACPIFKPTIIEVEDLDDTDRGEGGFGHTGVAN